MNIFTTSMLIFATIGLIDRLMAGRFGLAKCIDQGLNAMGGMAIPTVGMCCVGTEIIKNHIDTILTAMDSMDFDPSMIAGILLAPDMGGWFIAEQLTTDNTILIFNGIVLGALLGQMMTFQLPVFLSMLDREQHPPVLKGFMIGIVMIPVGFMLAAVMLKIDFTIFIIEFIPILVICILLALGLLKFPERLVKGFSVFASGVQAIITICFFFTMLGVFLPRFAYAPMDSVYEALAILLRSASIICGSLVISELVLRYFRRYLQKITKKLGVNEVTIVGLLLNCATSLAMIPLLPKMDEKGKMLNCAFSVSGAYVLGGQLGFVSSVAGGFSVTVMVFAKLVCGIFSMAVMYIFYGKLKGEREWIQQDAKPSLQPWKRAR